jgi:hypothetical protein|tara:strand:- start:23 stop:199 length:177 start_codon:yes stop_codon:yes gene_type:complete
MTHQSEALMQHINVLREGVVGGSTQASRFESAVLLIDIYEQILQNLELVDFPEPEVRH